VQRFREAGIELKRLKEAIQLLSSNETWLSTGKRKSISILATDGKKIFYPDRKEGLIELTLGQQRTFAFVLDVAAAQTDVKRQMTGRDLSDEICIDTTFQPQSSSIRRAKNP
jgi:hypothetical protein